MNETEKNNNHEATAFKPETDPNPISMHEIADDTRRLKEEPEVKTNGIFTVLPGNQWIDMAKNLAVPKMLFDEFWCEGEVCIFFADTNLGKSILAVQISDSISKGEAIPGFRLEAPVQKVLYFDFELSKKQFENRYSINYDQHYTWHDNFLRVEIDHKHKVPSGMKPEVYLNISLERAIENTGAKVLIVDNITYLNDDNERARDAAPMMKALMELRDKLGISILALTHTPKRDMSKPITINDVQGSKMLTNFCDSSFAIGQSCTDKNLRYLKQVKVRNNEYVYDAENVCICQVAKPNNFLQFELLSFGRERDHLKEYTDKDRQLMIAKAKELSLLGKTQRQIAGELGISLGAVNNYLHT